MATYKGIQGYTVQSLSSDPTASEAEGQLWYNSASNVWKISAAGTGAWASGGSLNTARDATTGSGIQTAAYMAGGYKDPYTGAVENEQYDGTSWTEAADLTVAVERAAFTLVYVDATQGWLLKDK